MEIEGVFSDEATIRRVHREHVLALAGQRALLMQAAHPVAFAGFFAHTGALDEPYARLHRTAEAVNLVVFGPRREAER
ncbi:MAG TPA: oxygenase MpaB family protein, partial [Conexibacter sp.]